MLYVTAFLAPYTGLSSKQNADVISKGYQFMQQFTLSLKASLASEAKALEREPGEVLWYLLQLSPSALLHRGRKEEIWIQQLLAPQHWEGTTTARGQPPPPPAQPSLRTYTHILQGTEHVLTGRVRAAKDVICKEKNKNITQVFCLKDTLELPPVSDALPPCRCALTYSCFSSCSLQTVLRSTRRNCAIISQKSHWRQQEAAAGGMETSLSSPFAGKVIWSLQLWAQPSPYTYFTAFTSKYLVSWVLVGFLLFCLGFFFSSIIFITLIHVVIYLSTILNTSLALDWTMQWKPSGHSF